MENSFSKKYFTWIKKNWLKYFFVNTNYFDRIKLYFHNIKKQHNGNRFYWIRICFNWIKISLDITKKVIYCKYILLSINLFWLNKNIFWYHEKSDIMEIYFIEYKFILIKQKYLLISYDLLFLQQFRKHPSQQILVSKTSRGCPPPVCLELPLKILFWPSRGRHNMTSWKCPDLTSWGCPSLRYQGLPKLTSKGRPLKDVLRTTLGKISKHILGPLLDSLLDVPKFHFTFLSELIRLT